MKVSGNATSNGIDADRLRQMNRRKEQNRNAQRRLRERKEEYTSQLEAQLTDLHRHAQAQEDENHFLREALERMRSHNHLLTQQIAMIHQSVPSTQESHPLPQRASIDLGTNHFAQNKQANTRSRSQSEAFKYQSSYGIDAVPSSQHAQHLPFSAPYDDQAKNSSSASPANRPMSTEAGSQTENARSPNTLEQDGSEPSPFDSDDHLRSGSEQTTATSSNQSDSASKSGQGTDSHSSYSSKPTSAGLVTSCLESVYTQPSRPSTTMTFEQPNRAAFDFAAQWTPSTGDYAVGNLMLSDFKGLDSHSGSKPFGVTPGALGLTNSGMPGLNASGDGWTMSPWLNMGNTPSSDAAKYKTDESFPDSVKAATDADHTMADDRHTSLASRRGFSQTLNLEQASF